MRRVIPVLLFTFLYTCAQAEPGGPVATEESPAALARVGGAERWAICHRGDVVLTDGAGRVLSLLEGCAADEVCLQTGEREAHCVISGPLAAPITSTGFEREGAAR